MIKTYTADLEQVTRLVIEFEWDDEDGIPTADDILRAAGYVENHRDTIDVSEEVVYLEDLDTGKEVDIVE